MSGEMEAIGAVPGETPRPNPEWDFKDTRDKLLALGVRNGDTSDLDAIIGARHARKPELVGRLSLGRNDVVMDLGSGLGYVGEVIAPDVGWLHCCDISSTMLADCRERLGGHPNIEFHHIAYADLSPVYGKGVNKVYSTLLFIHFNFYDILFYLRELNKVLTMGGLVYFDYLDGERYRLDNPLDSFREHVAIYKDHRETWVFGCMHMTSLSILRNLAPQLGFSIVANWQTESSFSQLLIRKVAEARLP